MLKSCNWNTGIEDCAYVLMFADKLKHNFKLTGLKQHIGSAAVKSLHRVLNIGAAWHKFRLKMDLGYQGEKLKLYKFIGICESQNF